MSRRRRWAVIVVLGLLLVPLILLLVGAILQLSMGYETHRFGHYAARFRGSLVVWRYHTHWIEIDFFEMAQGPLQLGFAASVILLVFDRVHEWLVSRRQNFRGFEVLITDQNANTVVPFAPEIQQTAASPAGTPVPQDLESSP